MDDIFDVVGFIFKMLFWCTIGLVIWIIIRICKVLKDDKPLPINDKATGINKVSFTVDKIANKTAKVIKNKAVEYNQQKQSQAAEEQK